MAVYLNTEPLSALAKNLAVKRETRLGFERFTAQSRKRWWRAKDLPQRREMAELGHLLQQDETGWPKEMLLGELATEIVEPYYVKAGIYAAGADYIARSFYEDEWGPQERRHWEALEIAIRDSGLMSDDQLRRYLRDCREAEPWTFENQTGHAGNDLVYGIAYAAAQERQTMLTYRATRERLWQMYGSPSDPVTDHKIYPGVCGVLAKIENDEGRHQGYFLQNMRIYLRYWPDRALEALSGVFRHYTMPKVHIPNLEEFIDAVIVAELADPKWVVAEVHNHVANRLGLQRRSAIRNALLDFRKLPDGENIVVQLPGKEIPADEIPQGCEVYTMHPNGIFEAVEQAA